MPQLGTHEGKPIRRTSIEVRNLAGGLHKAARTTQPRVIHEGEKAYVLAEVIGTTEHKFASLDGDGWDRVNITRAETVTIVDEELVKAVIEEQRARNRELEEQEKGLQPLPPVDRDAEHDQGLHKRPRKDCAKCDAVVAERAAARTTKKKAPAKKRRLSSV